MNKLYRSRRDKRITGLLGGLAEKFNIDATLLRLVVAIATIFSGGTIVPLYIIASIVIPKEPHYPYDPYANPYDRPGYGPYGEPFQRDPYQGGDQAGNGRYSHTWRPDPYREPSYRPRTESSYEIPKTEPKDNIDSMMKDIERKAMEKELEELRRKVADLEKNKIKTLTKEMCNDGSIF
ncbi:PspC domain-containing protein [Paenibacillus larvae]|nr:PspC domain-containing protein [Paenibacillus larvae]MDT2236137.1 PspC domain-containing protein [Paenibacillus larvae]MDT2246828.1 PspC domain-containing protein [Paenibacillus larvae]MDT2256418.1 PspC domain-containing protein [Paenibacillus larvae]MDT2258783.1 PspC domain-containing protein [Paenibacillus larvae]MDT2262872.1 PspC domain-containing protein [Paenibacillus larvae]